MARPFDVAPPSCRACAMDTVVRLEHTTNGTMMVLAWHCLRCHAYWAVAEAPPRIGFWALEPDPV